MAKRKFRYKVTLKGTRISRHFTKAAAIKAASKIYGARVSKMTSRMYKRRRRR